MRVLVIDGHPGVRERLVTLAAEVPGVDTVLQAASAAQAHVAVGAHAPEVIVLDLRIADDSGLSLAARLKRNRPSTTLIVLTSEPSDGLRRACIDLGLDHVFDKSKDLHPLQAAIARAAGADAP